MSLKIRPAIVSDLEIFFEQQADEQAMHMAAFTSLDPNDKQGFINKFTGLLDDDSINLQTILLEKKIIGSVAKYLLEGKPEITYALDKKYWGRGHTTKAVLLFLQVETARPMNARAAIDNIGSQKVLKNVGFKQVGTGHGFAKARGKEIEEIIYMLEE